VRRFRFLEASRRYPEEGTMKSPTIEQRVTGLEELVKPLVPLPGRVQDLETNAGPGQNQGFSDGFKEVRAGIKELRADFKKFGRIQAGHTSLLERQSAKLNDIQKDMYTFATDMTVLKSDMRDFKEQVSERLEQVDSDIADLKGDVETLKEDVSTLKGDVSTLKGDVSTLKGDVSTLKGDVAELKTDMVAVKGALTEILDRLPAKSA
jgi:chromosome segregation ATPase